MVIVLKNNSAKKEINNLKEKLMNFGIKTDTTENNHQTLMHLTGDTASLDSDRLRSLPIVESVKRISPPYKNAAKTDKKVRTVVTIGEASFGDESCPLIAGPCTVESEDQICRIAQKVKAAGAKVLRGGAYKPRTSPYSFQGLREEGIRLLLLAKKQTGLPVVTELMDLSALDLFEDVDIIQIGARNMQNFEILKEVGKLKKPVLLKRGQSATLKEWLMSAEYILSGGNESVILCERGIRTFETVTRNTLDISSVPLVKEMTHLPVIVDPSHATGISHLVEPMSLASVAAGADGLMIEVHDNPEDALCDGPQAVTPQQFAHIVKVVNEILPYGYKC